MALLYTFVLALYSLLSVSSTDASTLAGRLLSTTLLHNLSALSPADNLPWPTIYSLARETEISELGEILLHVQCRRDGRKVALASRR